MLQKKIITNNIIMLFINIIIVKKIHHHKLYKLIYHYDNKLKDLHIVVRLVGS